MRKTETEKIDAIVERFMRQIKHKGRIKEYQIIDEWHAMFGENVSNATRNIYVRDQKLYVYLNTPIIKNELRMLKDRIRDNLNRKCEYQLIDIVIR